MGEKTGAKVWTLASCMAAITSLVGFYFPYWLEGSYATGSGLAVPMFFGVFRRCNYLQTAEDGSVQVVLGCGRYSDFTSIPSVCWQISTIITGTGASLSLLLSVSALVTLCARDKWTFLLARATGTLQMSSGLLVILGAVIYPNGWDTTHVVQACGQRSGVYHLGDCSLGWAFYMTASGGAVTVICSVLTCRALQHKSYTTTYAV